MSRGSMCVWGEEFGTSNLHRTRMCRAIQLVEFYGMLFQVVQSEDMNGTLA